MGIKPKGDKGADNYQLLTNALIALLPPHSPLRLGIRGVFAAASISPDKVIRLQP